MADRVRVYILARELGLTNGELIELLENEGVEIKSHSSSIDGDIAELMREQVIAARQQQAEDASRTETMIQSEPLVEMEENNEQTIQLKPPVTVRDLAEALGKKPNELIGELMTMNIFAAINQVVEIPIVEQICNRHGYDFVRERRRASGKGKGAAASNAELVSSLPTEVEPRPPVVAFLGHVDHGKTSLQDAIRKTNVTTGEAGGITQHIGASVITFQGQRMTFLDTPGHEAFTTMRARGAQATDIAVVVVAADDGVMPQTVEAIKHAQAAGVPIIVAMNKIDLPGASPDRVMVGLQQHGLNPEDWGGDVGVIPVSAITGDGLSDLLERIMLESEMMELKCNPDLPGQAIVIEAQLEQGMGPTANILVSNGTICVGDVMLCGQYYGRVKALIDDRGRRVESAGPSCPVKVLGLSGAPKAGAQLMVCADEREAKQKAEAQAFEERQDHLGVDRNATLEDLFRQIEEESRQELKLIVKGDVRGSVEAIVESLTKIKSEKISVNIIHNGVGEITENDVLMAANSDAILIGFHVRILPSVKRIATAKGVDVRLYTIIYELIDEVQSAMRGRLAPETRETKIGEAEIKEVFHVTKTGKICGCLVLEGNIRVKAEAHVYREKELIYKGFISSLRHFQDDVRELKSGQECGIKLDNFEDFEVGDTISAFNVEKIAAEL
jgi:translation initiation factor IF-2